MSTRKSRNADSDSEESETYPCAQVLSLGQTTRCEYFLLHHVPRSEFRELQGRLRASGIGDGMAQSEVRKNSFANLLLVIHCKVQYLAWQQQNEDSSGRKSALLRCADFLTLSSVGGFVEDL